MHPRLLRTFLAIARHGNVTRAAAEVHLAQSSVSDQLQTLEAELGAALFQRTRAGLVLTPAGETLVPYAREMLDLADVARAAIRAQPGRLVVGTLETIAAARMGPWLAGFRASHPGIEIEVRIAGSGTLLEQLGQGEIDIAVCFDTGQADERFAMRRLGDEPLVLITAPDRTAPRDLAALAGADFVATERGCAYRHLFDKAFADAGLDAPKPAAEVGSISLIAALVTGGTGIGLVPRLGVAGAIERGEVRAAPWPGRVGAVSLSMLWRRRRVQPAALKALLDAAGQISR
ncbi:MAG: LysR family transcriptional regulator [Alphaproteobacteria bacterium]|jgi:DNA-binding transcriptional LysR family regulator|nr:LysR family transcriptional regulator [Alphaproteobacteria bacterium]